MGEVGKLALPGRGGRTGQNAHRVRVWVLATGEYPNEYPNTFTNSLFSRLDVGMSDVTIRPLEPSDWTDVRTIFAEGIATGHATFEAEPPSWEGFDSGKVTHSRFIAADEHGSIVGWVAASPVSARAVYSGVVEHSVYVSHAARGQGIGRILLQAFIDSAEKNGVWTIQSSIFPENAASIGLHSELGFRSIGQRERVAKMTYGPMAGAWRDTVLLERRSQVNGAD